MTDLKHRLRREKSQKEFDKSFIRDDHLDGRSFISRINWLNCTIVFGVPLLALYGVCTIKTFVWQTWVWAILYYFWTGLGITAGMLTFVSLHTLHRNVVHSLLRLSHIYSYRYYYAL